MNTRKWKGSLGEWVAVFVLILKGYRVVEMNHKGHFAEVDVVAVKGRAGARLLVLVEVKTRKTEEAARLAIHPDQRERLLRQAAALQRKFKAEEVRLDAVLVFGGWPWVRHVVGAF